jgi:hypothetical protein
MILKEVFRNVRRQSVAFTVLFFALGGGALAASAGPVVSRDGEVAGKGYPYWLKRAWLMEFAAGHPLAPCMTVTVNGKHVAFLDSPGLGSGMTFSYTCKEPAGRPVYVHQLSAECSTLKGDHKGFGTTAADLQKCARTELKHASYSESLDGHAIDLHKLMTATGEFFVPKVNLPGPVPPTAHSAAYGPGLLLRGLRKGTHTLHDTSVLGNSSTINYTIKVS